MDTRLDILIISGILWAMATITASPLADPQQIQGNILRAFAGRHQAFLALSFRSNRAGARAWLEALARRVEGTEQVGSVRRGDRIEPAKTLRNVGLTATGLVLLHPEVAGQLAGHEAFWRGPLGLRLNDGHLTTTAAMLGDIGDSDPRAWVVGGPGEAPVDALLTIAADDDETLLAAIEDERKAATDLRILHIDRGEALYDGKQRIEHFGFHDGISQPGIRGFRDELLRPGSPLIAPGEFVLGCPGERRPQSWTPRPHPARWMRGGSFQVFRRLCQDVAGWREQMGDAGDRDGAAARAIGRRADGTPLARDTGPKEQNKFDYRDDELGERTPLNAHIRKMNPREDGVFRDRGHKMLRRGITFGPPYDDEPGAERGILFNAYMASIEDQFEFVQRRWAHDPEFPATTLSKYGREPNGRPRVDGLDRVLGPNEKTAREQLPKDLFEQAKPYGFGGFVTTTGAVYAFAPSRRALEMLAGEAPID